MKKILLFIAIMPGIYSGYAQRTADIANGIWRGVLQRNDGVGIVFNFKVTDTAGRKLLYIMNAGNRLTVDDIRQHGDSVIIRLPFFDSEFRAGRAGDNELTGRWIKHLADRNVVIPFTARRNEDYRFIISNKDITADISGRWSAVFRDTITGKTSSLVGIFEQNGNHLTGSFLTRSGDYRFLEGVVDGDSLKISGFDGGYAQYFSAKIDNNNTISGGRFFSGSGPAAQVWTASRNDNAQLEEASSLEFLNTDVSPKLSFAFKDAGGNMVSFTDERFRNKIVIIQLMGSWCPNCMDETGFINQLYNEYKHKGVEVMGLSYERTPDFSRSATAVKNFMKRLGITYPVLIPPVAVSDPQRAEKTIPQLKKITAFPTTVFAGRDGTIKEVHAGFNGPGTGEDYEKQKEDFYRIVNHLLEE
jgi:thiol-disulfide isomerase/thioredoxin